MAIMIIQRNDLRRSFKGETCVFHGSFIPRNDGVDHGFRNDQRRRCIWIEIMIMFVGTTGGCGCLLLFQFHDALLCLCERFLESIDLWIVVVVVQGGRWLGKGLQRL